MVIACALVLNVLGIKSKSQADPENLPKVKTFLGHCALLTSKYMQPTSAIRVVFTNYTTAKIRLSYCYLFCFRLLHNSSDTILGSYIQITDS